MPTSHHPRKQACTHCHDKVLVAERTRGKVAGAKLSGKTESWLEHADPGPDGEIFDAVDDGCRRPPVA